jgi:hypothetical protein
MICPSGPAFLMSYKLQAVVLIYKGTLVHGDGRFGRGCCTIYGGLVKLGAGSVIGVGDDTLTCYSENLFCDSIKNFFKKTLPK